MVISSHENITVLLVEREPFSLHPLKKSLEQDPLFSFETVVYLEEAARKISEKKFRLVLFDMDPEFEEKDFKLLEKLKQESSESCFILLSTEASPEFCKKAEHAGINRTINKCEHFYGKAAAILCHEAGQKPPFQPEQDRVLLSENVQQKAGPVQVEENAHLQDELTGLCNYSGFYERIRSEYARAARNQHPLSCLILDINHFRWINDQFGPRMGDMLIKECGIILLQNCRLADSVARYGGEKFALLLPLTDGPMALETAKRLKRILSQQIFKIQGNEIRLDASIGIASFPQDPVLFDVQLLCLAEEALEKAKVSGGDSIVFYSELMEPDPKKEDSTRDTPKEILEFQKRMNEIMATARKAYLNASRNLVRLLGKQDPVAAEHSIRCAEYAVKISKSLGLSFQETEIIEHAALLHDIGKVFLPEDIQKKNASLSFVEYETMKQHPYLGYRLLSSVRFLSKESQLILHHHEWYNGKGYPSCLKGEEIPLGSRIISVVDAYDTMLISGASYRKQKSVEEAVRELVREAGSQFDPNIVKTFIDVLMIHGGLQEEKYHQILHDAPFQKTPIQKTEASDHGNPAN